ncbi:hypothetical protein B0H13DRAFT_2676997 [Mycena leptocephala]|nr:hypothetical protein B0H13DRAFT_2676997 [Mycena leptocephala]
MSVMSFSDPRVVEAVGELDHAKQRLFRSCLIQHPSFTRSRALKRRARSALTGKKVTSSSSSPTLGQHHHAWGLCRSSILVDARCVPIKDVTGCPPAIHQQRPDCHSSTRARAHDAPVKRGGRDRAALAGGVAAYEGRGCCTTTMLQDTMAHDRLACVGTDRLCGQAVTLDGGADGGWAGARAAFTGLTSNSSPRSFRTRNSRLHLQPKLFLYLHPYLTTI